VAVIKIGTADKNSVWFVFLPDLVKFSPCSPLHLISEKTDWGNQWLSQDHISGKVKQGEEDEHKFKICWVWSQ
jgi:hypothetical protein